MMKKMTGKVLLWVTSVCFLLSSTILYAGNGKILKDSISIDNNELGNVSSVALMSVYGECFVSGRKIQRYNDQKYAALEDFIKEKVSFLKNNTLNANLLPFIFLDEQSVLASEQYKIILKEAQKTMPIPDEVNLSALFSKKQDGNGIQFTGYDPNTDYYLPQNYGVYLANPLNETIIRGKVAEERARIYKELGCDAIYNLGIKITVVGLGGNVFGKENGKVTVEILANVEMPDGKKPYKVIVQAESDKETLFKIPLFGSEQQKELVIETAIKLSDQAWNLAWNTLNLESQKAADQFQRSKN